MTIPIREAHPSAHLHLVAVQAALHDGRLDLEAWAERAGVTSATVRSWLAGRPTQASYEARLWGAAVTTTVPGWPTPLDGMLPSTASR